MSAAGQTHRLQDGWEPWVPHTAEVASIRFWKSGPSGKNSGYLASATFKVNGQSYGGECTGFTQGGTEALTARSNHDH